MSVEQFRKALTCISSEILLIFLKRLLAPANIWGKLSIYALPFFCASLSPTIQEVVIETIAKHLAKEFKIEFADGFPFYVPPILLFVCIAITAYLSYKTSKTPEESLINTPEVIDRCTTINGSYLSIFCGNIESITIQAIVTSENTDFELGSTSGTSVSGRVRKMCAEFNANGSIKSDLLRDYVSNWKSQVGQENNFQPGSTISCPVFGAKRNSVERIFLAAILQKDGNGTNSISERAIESALSKILLECKLTNIKTVFIPIFGLGNGDIKEGIAINSTLRPMSFLLKSQKFDCNIYLGVFKQSHKLMLHTHLLKY